MKKSEKLSILYLPFASLVVMLASYLLITLGYIDFRGQFITYQFTDIGIIWGVWILIKNKARLCNATKVVVIGYLLVCVLNAYFFIFHFDPQYHSGISPILEKTYDTIFFITVPLFIIVAGFALIFNKKDDCR